jgi:hypothetical protein
MGFRYRIAPAGLGNILGYLGSVAQASANVSDVPRVIPRSACSEAAVEPFGGPAFEPLISSGRGARVA